APCPRERRPPMNRYRSERDDPNVTWTLALAAILASVVLVHWLAHVSVLVLAGSATGLLVALIASWIAFPAKKLAPEQGEAGAAACPASAASGQGHASKFELWLRWGRVAAARRARRSRLSLSLLERLTCPLQTSVMVARAHYNHACRVPVEEHVIYV